MSEMQRERDLVLNPNEYAYVLDKTKGIISCVVGSYKMSLSNSDALVIFNEQTKRFEEVSFDDAVATFVSAPENWYVELKNPVKTSGKEHPVAGTSNTLPDLHIGKKINITGNVSFALYPGQMAKVIQGHRLHSNQYLLARVYDPDALNAEAANLKDKLECNKPEEDINPEDYEAGVASYLDGVLEDLKDTKNEEDTKPKRYVTGELLVIKGTEYPFYIPPTGIEVIAVGGKGSQYVRNAVTLERLEYCILKNEKGVKKYIHGSAVVFPQPDEQFVENPNAKSEQDKYKFKAIELSDISGIYVKVVEDYTEKGKYYHAGDELFITGKEQMIYYPRPEHAIIDYEGQVVHHAIAIPAGEGRYILDRMKGDIKLVKGPVMYLPNPINEVVVQRRLSKKECKLWYPGNDEALEFNTGFKEDDGCAVMDTFYASSRSETCETGFSRKNRYSKPRTVVIDNKYTGAVAINIWTGYAVNVVSKNGTRKVVTGPTTYLMQYDESLEAITLSTGKPKTTDHTIETVYLRVDNNKVSDIINVQTKDFVDVSVKVSYCLDFLPEYKNNWFNVENYVKYMTDRQRSLLKMEAKKHTIEDFYENTTDIVRKILLNLDGNNKGKEGRLFTDNGMLVKDVEVLSVNIEEDVRDIINRHQFKMVERSLELANADKTIEVSKKLAEAEKEKAALKSENRLYELQLENQYEKKRIEQSDEIERMKETSRLARKEAEKELQALLDAIQKSELARQKEETDAEVEKLTRFNDIDKKKQEAYTTAVTKVIKEISPDLVSALTTKANADMLEVVTEAMGPYAIASNSSVADVTNMLLRGTSLENVLGDAIKAIKSDND